MAAWPRSAGRSAERPRLPAGDLGGSASPVPYMIGPYIKQGPVIEDTDEFPMACTSKAATIGSDTFDAKADGAKCYFKTCKSAADITFTTKFGARDLYSHLVSDWIQVTRATEGLSVDCPSLGDYLLSGDKFPQILWCRL